MKEYYKSYANNARVSQEIREEIKQLQQTIKQKDETIDKLVECVEYYIPILEERLSCGALARNTLKKIEEMKQRDR